MKNDVYKNLKTFHFADYIRSQFNKKSLSSVIFGNFGAQNFGDEAILSGELSELKKISNLSITVVSKRPKEILRLHKTSAVSLHKPFKIIQSIINSDFVIVGGGGIICKPDRGVIGIMYQLYMLLMYLAIPKILGKKVYGIGLGVYKNANPFVLKTSFILLKTLDLLTVRDFHSFELLKKHKVKSEVYKDNSFLMNQLPKKKVLTDKFFGKHYEKHKQNIGFALMQPENKSEEQLITAELMNFIYSNNKDTHYWFYACDFQKGFNNDLLFAKKIIQEVTENLGNKFNYSLVPLNLNPEIFFSSFMLMDYMVSMRLHSSIFAYRNNIEFAGISYDEKCTSFMESIGKIPVYLDTKKRGNKLFFATI